MQGRYNLEDKKRRRALAWFITGVGIFVSAVLLLAPKAENTGASQMSVSVNDPTGTIIAARGYYIILNNSHNIDINIAPQGGSQGTREVASDTVYAYTNAPSGYQLYISSDQSEDYDENHPGNALYQGGDTTSNNLLAPTTAADLSVNSWGYGLSDSTFLAVPLYGDMALIKETHAANTGADVDDESVATPVYYGARVNMQIPSGTYSGKVLYTALGEASTSATGEAVIMPNSTEMIVETTPVEIVTSLFTNATDLGEVTAYIGANGNAADACLNLSWHLEDDVLLVVNCEAPTRDLDLTISYDVYVNVPKYGKTYRIADGFTYVNNMDFWSITTMQEMTPNICAWATTPLNTAGKTTAALDTTGAYQGNTAYVAQRTLSDTRTPGTSYTIRKLADGECWMTSNLAYPLTAGVEAIGSKNDGSTFAFTPTPCATNGACALNGNTKLYNGNWYYSWYAATAMAGGPDDVAKTIDGSICPAGWRLPTHYVVSEGGEEEKSFGRLMLAYSIPVEEQWPGDYRLLDAMPMSFTRPGRYINGTIGMINDLGRYLTSTASADATINYNLTYTPRYVVPLSYAEKGSQGNSIRCVAL